MVCNTANGRKERCVCVRERKREGGRERVKSEERGKRERERERERERRGSCYGEYMNDYAYTWEGVSMSTIRMSVPNSNGNVSREKQPTLDQRKMQLTVISSAKEICLDPKSEGKINVCQLVVGKKSIPKHTENYLWIYTYQPQCELTTEQQLKYTMVHVHTYKHTCTV